MEKYVAEIKEQFGLEAIKKVLTPLKSLNVLLIGDVIIDRYTYTRLKGRSIKDPILSVEFLRQEDYFGGAIVVANHLSSFVNKVKLVSIIGDRNSMYGEIKKSLSKNIEFKHFVKKDSPTNIKERIVDDYRVRKMFKVEYINDKPLDPKLSKEVVDYLKQEISKHDLVVVSDFGHGFINEEIRDLLEEKSKFLAVNSQTNSSNLGFNYITLYNKVDFMTMNEDEIRMPFSMRFEEMDSVIKKVAKRLKHGKFLVTRGKYGCTYVNNRRFTNAPTVTKRIKDTVGAGDALFAMAALLTYQNTDDQLLAFLANCAGGMAANIVGNKYFINKEGLLHFVGQVYENGTY